MSDSNRAEEIEAGAEREAPNGRRAARLRLSLPTYMLDGLLTCICVYILQWLLCRYFISQQLPPRILAKPFSAFPGYLYLNWDVRLYRELYEVYNQYFWPPLYPFALRLVTLCFHFQSPAFEKSALIVNLLSHLAIAVTLSYYVRLQTPRTPGWLATFLLFFYPGHNVFFAAYSESLYLALSLVAFVLYRRGNVLASSLTAGVSSLVRTMGSFVVGAIFLMEIWQALHASKRRLRGVLRAVPGVVIVLGWQMVLYRLGTSIARENRPWAEELAAVSVQTGQNVRIWVLHYLAFSSHWTEVIAFWAGIAALVWCVMRRCYPEALYIFLFYSSLAIYVYRPFPWSRLVSVLFPLHLLVADLLRNKPRLAAVTVACVAVLAAYMEIQLFFSRIGEP